MSDLLIVPYINEVILDAASKVSEEYCFLNFGLLEKHSQQYNMYSMYCDIKNVSSPSYAQIIQRDFFKEVEVVYSNNIIYLVNNKGERVAKGYLDASQKICKVQSYPNECNEHYEIMIDSLQRVSYVNYFLNNDCKSRVFYDTAGQIALLEKFDQCKKKMIVLYKNLEGDYLEEPEIFYNETTLYKRILNYICTNYSVNKDGIFYFDESTHQFKLR